MILILHTPHCAHTPQVEALVRDVAPDAKIALQDVTVEPHPAFAGSPTVLVDGRDLEPDARPIEGFA